MDLTHRFTVPVPVGEAWATFNDLELVAPCFPGAALTSYDGTDFAGLVKVKLGPISLQYNGTGSFVERDEASHRAVIEAKGKDKRGNGTAAASITAQLAGRDDGTTDVEVLTTLNITGRPAQFGRGVMQDVSDKLLGQFTTNLEARLGSSQAEPAVAAEETAASPSKTAAAPSAAETAPAKQAAPANKEAPAKQAAAAKKEAPAKKAAPTKKVAATAKKVATKKSAPAKKTAPARSPSATETAAAALAPPEGETRSTAPGPPGERSETVPLDLGATVLPVLLRRYAPYLVVGLVGLLVVWRLRRRG
jgi:carbon monoxide dehydrogenase subunit G